MRLSRRRSALPSGRRSSSASAPSCDAFVGVVREVCGDWDRDALLHDDVTFSQSSRTTWAAGLLALAVVAADAAMLDAAIGLDVRHEGGGDDGDGGAGARGWDGGGTPLPIGRLRCGGGTSGTSRRAGGEPMVGSYWRASLERGARRSFDANT